MPIENQMPKINDFQQEREKAPDFTLDEFLAALEAEGIKTLPAQSIINQLETTGVAIVTRDYNSGIRISKEGRQYKSWTTNKLEDPNHPLSQKFGRKDITIE